MTFFNLNQAAAETGKAKSTIFKALKTGKLSYVEKNRDGYQIEASELFRVFPRNSINEQSETIENTQETIFLRRENELLREQLKREQERADNAEKERRQLMAMLTHQTAAPQDPEKKESLLFQKLFGRRAK